jgi:hypothetical protein
MKTQQQSDVVVPASQDAKQYARHRPDQRFASGCAGQAIADTLGAADQRRSRPSGAPTGAQDGPERRLGHRTHQAPRALGLPSTDHGVATVTAVVIEVNPREWRRLVSACNFM